MDFEDKTLVLGIGAQKTGTTWLHRYLSRRPEIYIAPIKERHYFDGKYRPDICGAMERRFAKRLDDKAEKPNFGKKESSNQSILNLKARVEMKNDSDSYKE